MLRRPGFKHIADAELAVSAMLDDNGAKALINMLIPYTRLARNVILGNTFYIKESATSNYYCPLYPCRQFSTYTSGDPSFTFASADIAGEFDPADDDANPSWDAAIQLFDVSAGLMYSDDTSDADMVADHKSTTKLYTAVAIKTVTPATTSDIIVPGHLTTASLIQDIVFVPEAIQNVQLLTDHLNWKGYTDVGIDYSICPTHTKLFIDSVLDNNTTYKAEFLSKFRIYNRTA